MAGRTTAAVLGKLAPLRQVAGVPAACRIALTWLGRHRFGVGLAGALAVVFVYRIVMIRSQVGLGVDAGNYLATMRQLFGADVTGVGLQRPPLVGIVLWPLAHLFGPLTATKLLAVAVSVLMGVPFYLLCSRFVKKGIAAAFSLPFIFSPAYMDALNWGFLTLVGVGLFTLCFYLIYELVTAPSVNAGRVLSLGLCSLALMAANRSSTFVYVVTVLTFGTAVLVARARRRRAAPELLLPALVALPLSLPFISTYLNVSSAVGDRGFLAAAHSPDDLRASWDTLCRFFGNEVTLAWAAAAGFSLAGAVALYGRTRFGFALLMTLFLAPLAVCLLVTGEIAERAAYFLYLPLWLGVAVCADVLLRAVGERRTVAAGGSVWGLATLALLAAIIAWRGHVSLLEATEFYGYLGDEHVEAIETADRQAPAGAGVAYPWPLGQWTEGLAGRRVLSATHAILTGERVTTNGLTFVADAYSVSDVPMDPVVGVDNGVFKQLLYLDDRLIQVECGEGTTSLRFTLADARSQRRTTMNEGGAWVDRRTYEMDGLQVVKEVRLPGQGEQVAVTLWADCEQGLSTTILVPLQPALPSVSASLDTQQAIFVFTGWNPFTSVWSARAYLDVASSTKNEVLALILGDEQGVTSVQSAAEATAVALVKTRSSRAEMTLNFTVEGWPSGNGAGLRTFTAEDAIEDYGVTFAVVDREPSKPWFGDPLAAPVLAWLDTSPYFQRLSDNGKVAAYRVALPAASSLQTRSATHGQ
jgi:hypothetical protein